ncbi:MAG: hypothetical protein KBS41_04135 [Oscillospiraceae bacterium]|nr:hypothetical protein [Candidatus Equicaccousia limihippi]
MIALMIIGIVLLCILLILLVLFLIPVDVILQSEAFIPTVTLSVLGIKKEVYNPNAPKPDKPAKSKPLPRIIKKLLGIENFDSGSSLQKSVKKQGIGDTLHEFFAVIKNYIRNLKQVIKSLTVRSFRFDMVCAEEDSAKAALLYGTSCAIVYPLGSFFAAYMKDPQKQLKLNISCDYELKSPTTYYELVLRIRLLFLLKAAITVAKNNVME